MESPSMKECDGNWLGWEEKQPTVPTNPLDKTISHLFLIHILPWISVGIVMLLLDMNIFQSLLITPCPHAWCLETVVCFRDIAFIFQMPPSLMSVSCSPTSDKCLRDIHLPCTLHPSLQVPCLFLSKEWFSNIFFLAPCVCCEMISPLVGLCPVRLCLSFASTLWDITTPVNLFHHFDDRLTSAWKDNLLFPHMQIVDGREIRLFCFLGPYKIVITLVPYFLWISFSNPGLMQKLKNEEPGYFFVCVVRLFLIVCACDCFGWVFFLLNFGKADK